jgi:uncharacterized protein
MASGSEDVNLRHYGKLGVLKPVGHQLDRVQMPLDGPSGARGAVRRGVAAQVMPFACCRLRIRNSVIWWVWGAGGKCDKPTPQKNCGRCSVSGGLAAPVAAGPFEDGASAVKTGDYATVMRLWLPLAEQGQAWAQLNLGRMYDSGQGVLRDDGTAATWYRKAADQGNAKAQSNLGLMYLTGRGVPQDFAEAVKWYGKAADQGDAAAQYNLGVMYDSGQGVLRDDGTAANWYRKAADQGLAAALYNLGGLYESGRGVPQDFISAYMWFHLAAAQGQKEAVENRDAVAQSMTPTQIADAQRLAREWRPK